MKERERERRWFDVKAKRGEKIDKFKKPKYRPRKTFPLNAMMMIMSIITIIMIVLRALIMRIKIMAMLIIMIMIVRRKKKKKENSILES